jgi:hypothetical protein
MMTATGRTVSAAVQIVPYGAVVAKVRSQRVRHGICHDSHGEEKGETGPANPVKTMACSFRKWSQTW